MVCSHNSLWDSIFQLLIFNSWRKFRGRIIDLWYALVYCPFIYKAIFCFVLPTYPLPFLAKMGILEASKYLDCWSSKLTSLCLGGNAFLSLETKKVSLTSVKSEY